MLSKKKVCHWTELIWDNFPIDIKIELMAQDFEKPGWINFSFGSLFMGNEFVWFLHTQKKNTTKGIFESPFSKF